MMYAIVNPPFMNVFPVRVPDAGVYMVGLAVLPSHLTLFSPSSTQLSAPQPPSGTIEVSQKQGWKEW